MIKHLKENIQKNLLDIGLGNDFFRYDTKSTGNKSKNKQVGLHQSIAKETINKMQRQPKEWEKIFANHISDKVFISKIYKELIQLNSKKTSNQI